MSETESTVTCQFYNPITGIKENVEIKDEDRSSVLISQERTERGIEIIRRNPEYDTTSWFEIKWTMEKDENGETPIEDESKVLCICPACGNQYNSVFIGTEFEELTGCQHCGNILTRDEPTESNQSQLINYAVEISE